MPEEAAVAKVAAVSVGLVGGKQYGVGLAMSTPVIYYNADLVKRAGGDPDKFPTTWDGIIDLAKRIEALDGGGKYRGMPDLNLTESQIDEIIAYLQLRK